MKNPYDGIKFEKRVVKIKNDKGEIVFEREVEFPDYFTENSVNIVTRKYLANTGKIVETSLKQMIDRVSETIAKWGKEDGYFSSEQEYEDFLYKLKFYQVHQYMAFNSPVYFNVGLQEHPQVSACFILKIEDTMESIGEIGQIELTIFKNGSGSGINYSPLRASTERVRESGLSSGPLAFLKWHDIGAGATKSGGTFRRSAKLACLNDDHPDIFEFIRCKIIEENKLRTLKAAGIVPYTGYEMKDHVYFQNTNLSVGTTDKFMKAVEENMTWSLIPRREIVGGYTTYYESFPAKDLFDEIVNGAWEVGCPGLLFLDTINSWNTCKESGEINSTNPCGELCWLDDSACALASFNLLKFFNKPTNHSFQFDERSFKEVVSTLIVAHDILIGRASYPTNEVAKNSRELRPIGIGFSNLHALLMYLGLPYDSNEGRAVIGSLTSLMTSQAYLTSANLASKKGSFKHFDLNKESMLGVVKSHYKHSSDIYISNNHTNPIIPSICNEAYKNWESVIYSVNNGNGLRNSQVTLIAPTGTISFLMGCETFGIQPEFSLVKYKNLSEGDKSSIIPMLNQVFIEGLRNLGYLEDEITSIKKAILEENKSIEDSGIKKEHLSIFDTEMRSGNRSLGFNALISMMATVQPLISGAISSTINVPNDTTREEIHDIFFNAWKMGLKGITIYRDGSKSSQPLTTKKEEKKVFGYPCKGVEITIPPKRTKLPKTRKAINHRFQVGGCEGYLSIGEYPDGRIGEIFITVSKQGSTLNGLLDSLAITTSMYFQYGLPLYDLVRKMIGTRFEPAGFTDNKDIRLASSIIDYIYRFIGITYLKEEEKIRLGLIVQKKDHSEVKIIPQTKTDHSNPLCPNCGQIMSKIGSCYNCLNCGESTGSCG